MAKRNFVVRANFPLQQTDLVENIEATSWPAAIGMAARRMKKRMTGRRIKAVSFTLEQLNTVPGEPVVPVSAPEQQQLIEQAPGPEATEATVEQAQE